MFRRRGDQLEVLLAHPGGPLYRNKDDGVWTIPKGEIDSGEDLLRRARIEFEEEVGIPAAGADWIDLGWVKQKGGTGSKWNGRRAPERCKIFRKSIRPVSFRWRMRVVN